MYLENDVNCIGAISHIPISAHKLKQTHSTNKLNDSALLQNSR